MYKSKLNEHCQSKLNDPLENVAAPEVDSGETLVDIGKCVRVAVTPYPMFSCGAGPCSRRKMMKEGVTKGRFFFVCLVTKGQGACNFFQWEDETKLSPQSTSAVQESPEMVEKSVQRGACGQKPKVEKPNFHPHFFCSHINEYDYSVGVMFCTICKEEIEDA